jgi:para-aminobenzoate synthetase / 4-amino-4-deoxychorismate lyase
MSTRPRPEAGVFETLLVRDGRPIELDAHLGRLEASLAELYGASLPAGAAELVRRHASGVALGRLRLTVAAAEASVRVADVDEELVFPAWERARWLRPLTLRGGIGAHKWADRRLLEAAERRAGPGALPLIVDFDGAVLEASRANVFVVSDGALATPRPDGRLLAGVTRRRVLELAVENGIDAHEDVVTLDELTAADEVFLTSAVRGIEPVNGCGGAAQWSEGPVARLLARQLERRWERAPVKEAAR